MFAVALGSSTFVAAIFSNLLTATRAGVCFLPPRLLKKTDCIEFPSAFPSRLFPSRGSLWGKKASRGWMSEHSSVVGEAFTRRGPQ
jgi:hypothetical protein